MLNRVGTNGSDPHKRINDAYALDWVTTLSPVMVLNARVSFGRYIESTDSVTNRNFDMTTLGFPASLASSLPYSPGFGRYALDDYLALGKYGPGRNVTNTWATAVSATRVNGTRTTKAGVDLRWVQYAAQNPGTVFQLNSSRIFTQADYTRADALSGSSVAGFLLGTPSSGTVNYQSFFIYMAPYIAPWVQHDWKMTSRLMLNLGFRFDFNVPPNERYNRLNRGFDANVVSPVDAQIDHKLFPDTPAPIRGGLLFAGQSGVSNRAANTYWNTWQPRIGLSWALNSKTVIRGGWGRFYANPSNNFQQSYGFTNQTTMSVSPDSNRTAYPNMINNPFPTINQPRGSADGLLTYAGRAFNFVSDKFRTPHTDIFSVAIQRAMGAHGRLEIAYSGSRGYDQEGSKTFNEQGDGAFRDRCNLLLGGSAIYCDAAVPNPFRNIEAFRGTSSFTATTQSRNQILRPFPQFTTLTEMMLSTGRSWYNSLQAVYSVRIRKAVNLNVNYTFAKNMQRTGYLDPQNDIMQQGVTGYDRPHRFVASLIGGLPFGQGRRWLNGTHGVFGRFISGWESTLMFTATSGLPWALPSNVMYLKDAKLDYGWGQEKIQAVKPCVNRWNSNNTVTMMQFSQDYGCTEANWLIVPNLQPAVTRPTTTAACACSQWRWRTCR